MLEIWKFCIFLMQIEIEDNILWILVIIKFKFKAEKRGIEGNKGEKISDSDGDKDGRCGCFIWQRDIWDKEGGWGYPMRENRNKQIISIEEFSHSLVFYLCH